MSKKSLYENKTFAIDLISRLEGLPWPEDYLVDSNHIVNGCILGVLTEGENPSMHYETLSLGQMIVLNDLLTAKLEEVKRLLLTKKDGDT